MSYTPDRLTNLDDVTIVTPSTGQVLKYNATSAKWENGVDATGAGGSALDLQTFPMMSQFPYLIGATAPTSVRTLTPTAFGATTCRIYPFFLPGTITINAVIMQTVAAVAASMQLGIFGNAGTRLWTSGAQATTAGNTVVTTGLPLTLTGGTYYFGMTNNNAVSAVAAYQMTPAFTAATVPRWGTVPATAGAMPASIDPAQITETVGGFPCYVTLNNWST